MFGGFVRTIGFVREVRRAVLFLFGRSPENVFVFVNGVRFQAWLPGHHLGAFDALMACPLTTGWGPAPETVRRPGH